VKRFFTALLFKRQEDCLVPAVGILRHMQIFFDVYFEDVYKKEKDNERA